MMSIGIRKDHKNGGATALILKHSVEGLIKHNVKYVETGPQLEDNLHVQNLWKNFDHKLVKRHRCWGIKVPTE